MSINTVRQRILEIVSDEPMTAQDILQRLGSETNAEAVNAAIRFLTSKGDIQMKQYDRGELPTFTAAGIDLGVDVPEFLKRESDPFEEVTE
ncbi:MAG: hypothetical protein V7731_24170 [Amphritea sp.]